MLACAFLFVYSLAGEIFLFKIVKMNLTNLQRKKWPQLIDQLKHNYILISALSANTFQIRSNRKCMTSPEAVVRK